MRSAITATLVFLAIPAFGLGHGGQFRRPADRAPTTGGPAPGAGTTVSGAEKQLFDRWEVWWLYNREPYLPRHALTESNIASATTGFLVGRSSRHRKADVAPMGATQERILDALFAATADPSEDVVDSAAIALARIGGSGSSVTTIRNALQELLEHDARKVREASILSLGILGHELDQETLLALVGDTEKGRVLLGRSQEVDTFSRSLAALSLGLMDQPGSADLLAEVAGRPDTAEELAASCIMGLGLLEREGTNAAAALGSLFKADLNRRVHAQIPIAIQRLPRPIARAHLSTLVEALQARNCPAELERSIAIALGNLATPEDTVATDQLQHVIKKSNDVAARNFALIALARLYEGLSEGDTRSPSVREAATELAAPFSDLVVRSLRNKARRPQRAFAALAAGLFLRSAPEATLAHDGIGERLTRALLDAFGSEREASQRSAFAIAVGLGEVTDAIQPLREAWEATRNPAIQGHISIALALLSDRDSIPRFRERVADEGIPTALRVELARALGMLQDASTLGQLVSMLGSSSNLSEASSAAVGLALVGDARISGPVLRILTDLKAPDARRAFAAVALGILAERDGVPWNLPLSIDTNYTLRNRAWAEAMSIL